MRFNFLNPPLLADRCLQLHLLKTEDENESFSKAPMYRFGIQLVGSNQSIGHINLRIGHSDLLTLYIGHIGYGVDEAYRGHHYAERACRLLLPFAAMNGLRTVWLTCSPDNIASRRTLQRLGAEYVETVPVPQDYPLPDGAIREKCRYRILHV